ncbi:DinB/UmuC family translesion DNA polymerase [Gordonibacter massiliensis (ex Traore et al. 2017)]|uniref:DNA repair protein n=1 Tax=Gordonibacter massiliensis (ex Traore et al. 2017) TaxID=1841863 RepID=A0A842JC46_9ACTN|nr:DNA repair protein [Gordonibacter massiliensis (ex Traore et al. 2017)]MBC2889792.1 DNA repair protein [Gordonibacter massiliensis (ex Traore et al. 2017)]
MERTYVCIDLKSFYASVECVDRGLDPLTANLVVADPDRTEKTICLAITPSMKALGLSSRCRVFEIPACVEYVMARPRMQRYMEVSADIYSVYLRYVSPEDIHPYSIDECFIDATPYLSLYQVNAKEFAIMLMEAVLAETGVRATAGIGPNLFLAKVALDITAKHADDCIGFLDRAEFERTIQTHRPITDIWNIGPGIAKRLAKYGVRDLRGVCEMSEAVLYREFGVNAEYLIDHAHGVEPCTIADIHAYEPSAHSLMNGQVLPCDYTYDEAKDVLKEMVDQLVLDLVDKGLVADSVSLYVGYAKERGADVGAQEEPDAYFDGGHGRRPASGRRGGPHTGGTRRQPDRTNLYSKLMPRFLDLFEETARKDVPIRRINVGFGGVMPEEFATMDLFTDAAAEAEERNLQKAVLAVKGKFGKNALLRGTSLKEKATARERNEQIGGHHA